ncbi:hypothetical protein GOP47_0028053 [Adiantum capillus-veneris]|nr:hypothetical protein GOP47_0028053 [Adiantum capillus-veneris]
MAVALRSTENGGTEPPIRLVWADGNARDIAEAITASEALMISENGIAGKQLQEGSANWLICDSAALRVGKRACPMHPEEQLERGRLYFVLPMAAFQQRLTWSYIACLAAIAATAAADGGAAAVANATLAHRSFARVPLLKSYLAFLLSRPRRRYRAFLARLRRKHIVDDAHLTADEPHDVVTSRSQQLYSHGSFISRCSAIRASRNVCHSGETHCKYVEQLILRSTSWRPPLLTIHE